MSSLEVGDVIADFGAKGDGAADDTASFQAMLDQTAGKEIGWVPYPPAFYKITGPLYVPGSGTLMGPGFQGLTGPLLKYYGPDGTHAINGKGFQPSQVRIQGIRIDDARTGATSGDGIHLVATNGSLIEHVGSRFFPNAGCYIGGDTSIGEATGDNYAVKHCWFVGQKWGLQLQAVFENCLIDDIKGDTSTAHPMQALVYARGGAAGTFNPVVRSLKMEVPSTGVVADLVKFDSTFNGIATLAGLFLYAGGRYVIRNESPKLVMRAFGLGTNGPITALVSDSISGRTWGIGTNQRQCGYFALTTHPYTLPDTVIVPA